MVQRERWLLIYMLESPATSWQVKMKVTQSCLTLCDPVDCTVHGILQARTRDWVAVPSSRGSSRPRDRTQVSHIAGRVFTSWATREAQEYWSGSLSLLQGIFPIHYELSNRGLLHCTWFLSQMSHRGSPPSGRGWMIISDWQLSCPQQLIPWVQAVLGGPLQWEIAVSCGPPHTLKNV